ncbi:sterol desaturase family protein [Lentisalinibacter salinarum]|uniref:sterol desaturase family protein n=1 Tax=Lentisalinibacter salinarum TaxID=2992239 RepID=UPI00386BF17A
MEPLLADNEALIRGGFFLGILLVLAGAETLAPRRERQLPRRTRWFSNLGIVLVNTTVLRLAFPLLGIGVALIAAERGWGLLNAVAAPWWIAWPASILLLDLAVYLQHVMFHALPALWRLHRMHHADLDFDVTTGLRFHPLEILISMIWKMAVIAALGAPAGAVLIFEVLLNATSMFNHSNLAIPRGIDRVLRWFVVTPDMHRVHHSIHRDETNSNFGFNLPWWDRLLGTYRDQPRDGHDGMTIGIGQFRDPADLRLDRMLLQPWQGDAGGGIGGPRGTRER